MLLVINIEQGKVQENHYGTRLDVSSFDFYAYCSSVPFTFLVRDPRLLIVLKPESR